MGVARTVSSGCSTNNNPSLTREDVLAAMAQAVDRARDRAVDLTSAGPA